VSGLYLLGIMLFLGFFRNSERDIDHLQEIEMEIADELSESFDAT
jgi:hypothetical protein